MRDRNSQRPPNRVVDLARRAVRFEIGTYRSLFRWARRRPDVPPGGTGFAYRGPLVAPMVILSVVSAIEIVVLDLLAPWASLRITLLALGVWGALVVVGMLAAVTVYPHVVGPGGLRLRHGTGVDAHLPWDAVAGARQVRGGRNGRTVQVVDSILHVLVGGQYTVEITLARPVELTLARLGTVRVSALRVHADDAAGLVAAIQAGAAREPGAPGAGGASRVA